VQEESQHGERDVPHLHVERRRMFFGMDDRLARGFGMPAAVALLGLTISGCGGGTQSADQALNKAIETSGSTKQNVAKFSGTVTIDGKPPGEMGFVRTIVILWDKQKPPTVKTPPLFVATDDAGKFDFTTYAAGDGISPGTYVVCFAQLKGGLRLGGARRGWEGPDQLKNLYNDPDKNKDEKQFVVEISPPGKSDWTFNLEVAGKEPVATPGPNSFVELRY
jgi:hypothetical protein